MTEPASSAVPGRLREVFGLDPRSLALFRIGLGVLLLANLAGRAPYFRMLYGAGGVLPEEVVTRFAPGWTAPYFAYQIDGSGPTLLALALVSAAFALMLVLGWRTRLATVASWFLLVSLNTRNYLATSYDDYVLTLLLFFAMFLPLGARFSLDSRARAGPAPQGSVLSGGSVALILQFACIYFFSALLKTGETWHSEGSAVFYALSQNYVARFGASAVLEQRELLALLTRTTFAWELLVGPLLLLPFWNGPIRTLVVVSVWGFHAGLGLFMTLFLFPWVMAVGAVALLPAWAWERLPGGARPRAAASQLQSEARAGRAAWLIAPLRWLTHAVPLLALAYVLAFNLVGLSPEGELPAWLRSVGSTLRLNQRWAMYAPDPTHWDYFHVIPGSLADGRRVDLLRDGRVLTPDPPDTLPWRGPSRAWALYLDHARAHRHKGPGLGLASWYCRSWNQAHAGSERLVKVEWLLVRFDLRRERAREDLPLGAWSCPAGPGGLTRPVGG